MTSGGTSSGTSADSLVIDSLRLLAEDPAVSTAADAARQECTRLRWHPALRRRAAWAAAESRVRGGHASASLDGVRIDLATVRKAFPGGAEQLPGGVTGALAAGAVAVTARTESLARALASGAIGQVLTNLHIAAAGHLLAPPDVGRLRRVGEDCRELVDVGPALPADGIPQRMELLTDVLRAPASVPAGVIAAIAHAEIATVRPYLRGNGLVARALERLVIQVRGLDPLGVAVPEAGHLAVGAGAYQAGLAAYALGEPQVWLVQCGRAQTAGAQVGVEVCDSILAGEAAR